MKSILLPVEPNSCIDAAFAVSGMLADRFKGEVECVTLKPSIVDFIAPDPVVVVLYLAPGDFPNLLATATLQGWNGFLPYKTYKDATPIVTPRVTVTPQ